MKKVESRSLSVTSLI